MFLTVIYPSTQVPEAWRTLYRLNPMQVVVEGFRWGLLGKGFGPDWVQVVSAAGVLILLLAGAYVFRRTERNIVDVM
jgi:lipopolysaccharide transport system permease protein